MGYSHGSDLSSLQFCMAATHVAQECPPKTLPLGCCSGLAAAKLLLRHAKLVSFHTVGGSNAEQIVDGENDDGNLREVQRNSNTGFPPSDRQLLLLSIDDDDS